MLTYTVAYAAYLFYIICPCLILITYIIFHFFDIKKYETRKIITFKNNIIKETNKKNPTIAEVP
jgi:hypothetical protein